MDDTQQQVTRSNDQGDPCPSWCVSRHGHKVEILGKMTPVRQHSGARQTHYAPDYGHSAELRLLQYSADRSARLIAGAYAGDGRGKEIAATTADGALALALLVEAAGAMDDAGRAALAAGLRAAAAALPDEVQR